MIRTATLLAATAVFAVAAASAGTLRVGVPEVEGNHVVLPVLLEGDVAGGVAALDFTLNYDPAVFSPVSAEASAAAQAARKQVESNEVSPGNYVVMMFGMNQTTVANGQVASITLNKHSQPSSNQSDISIKQTTFASLDGGEISSEGSSQTVTFAPPPTDDGNSEEPPPSGETPPPVEPPSETPVPEPTTPVSTPEPAPPSTPSSGGGVPQQPTAEPEGAPKASQMVIASAAPVQPAPPKPRMDGVANLNRASQRLDSSRAAIGRSSHVDRNVTDATEVEGEAGNAKAIPVMKSAGPQSPEPAGARVNVALAPAAGTEAALGNARVLKAVEQQAADSSGIPPKSRRMLIVVAAAIAAGIIGYRLTKRFAR